MYSEQVTPMQQCSLTFHLHSHKSLKNVLDVILCKNVGTVSHILLNYSLQMNGWWCKELGCSNCFLSVLAKMVLKDSVLLDNFFHLNSC